MSASVIPSSPIRTISGRTPLRRRPRSWFLPKSIGLPCSSTSWRSSRTSRSVNARCAPSLKMLQFWRTSTKADPRWKPARSRTPWRCSVCVSTARATKLASAARATTSGGSVVGRAGRGRLRLLPELRRRRRLALRQTVDAVVEHHDPDVDVAAHRMEDVVAADRERVPVTSDHPHHELGASLLEPGRDRRRAAVDRVEAVRIHVVRQAPGAADPGDEDDVSPSARRSRASPSGSGQGSSSRRSPGTSGPPGRWRSPCGRA